MIRVLDHVRHCDTAADGRIINRVLLKSLSCSREVELSFDGVFDVPSSFVNTAIVDLLNSFSEHDIKDRLRIVNATRQIADMVRRCLANGVKRRDDDVNSVAN